MANDHPEIIIVRRPPQDDNDHHGGVWKIAFADFMTTLMALFLVLWLTRVTSDETKTSIANYFNPISLSQPLPLRKGLSDPQPGSTDSKEGNKASDTAAAAGTRDRSGTLPPGSAGRERELFQDPYSVLAHLATESDPDKPQSTTIGDLGEAGRRGGDVARDPFDPLYWQVTTLSPAKTDRPAPTGITPPPAQARPDARGPGDAGSAEAEPPVSDRPDRQAAEAKAPEVKAAGHAATGHTATANKVAEIRDTGAKAAEAPIAGSAPIPAATAAAQAALQAEIAKIFPPSAPGPRVEVQGTSEGLLINVTDDLNFSMFAVGSAEPRPEMVRAMERLAKALASRPGRLIIRGHTDSRPFRSDVYDNWRLSTARAHMASYMLIRAGIEEARIWRVEGAADRMPRNAPDPKAPENRRIEILLQGIPG
ncbi:MotB family protein [Methylobacterium fujisawaense]|uniref:MotB family protein n=1 Tax=Methylobacterium fujisawaense TaxID=107400 RepID=UPI00313DF708